MEFLQNFTNLSVCRYGRHVVVFTSSLLSYMSTCINRRRSRLFTSSVLLVNTAHVAYLLDRIESLLIYII